MVYLLSDNFEKTFRLDFVDCAGSDWYDVYANSQGEDYLPPSTPLIACMAVERYAPGEPPAAMGAAYAFFCNDAVRDIIEDLEPYVHDFVPMDLRYGVENEYDVYQYYVVRPQHFINALDVEESDVEWRRILTGDLYWKKKPNVPLRLIEPLVDGKHLWRAAHNFSYTLISNEVYYEIHKQRLVTCWKFEKQFLSDGEIAATLEI